jgi:phosphoglycolate phosphatase-like HAD superfamily hydrolase
VRLHHEAHGGVSRYDKFPLYLRWAGEHAGADQVQDFCNRFSRLVYQGIIDAPWVAGMREYLQEHHARQHFVLMTATPQEEIIRILQELRIANFFREVHGAPTPKPAIVRDVLQRLNCCPDEALVVGDSTTDLDAANTNKVAFLLRRTRHNAGLSGRYSGPVFESL